MAHLRHADARQRCLFMGVERKSSVRRQTHANDPNETSASFIILALCRNFWNAPIDRVCVENPQMHRHGKERIPRR
jgi:hypothetical protein